MNLGYYLYQWYERIYPPNRWQAFLLAFFYSSMLPWFVLMIYPYWIGYWRLIEMQEPAIRLITSSYYYLVVPPAALVIGLGGVQVIFHWRRVLFNAPYPPIHKKLELWSGLVAFLLFVGLGIGYGQLLDARLRANDGYVFCQAFKVPVIGQDWEKIHSGLLVRQELAGLCLQSPVPTAR